MIDRDLAKMYQVATKVFNQAVKRNIDRFPEDFMFRLTEAEFESLRSQFVTSKIQRGGSRYLPMAFLEPGVAMLSSVLNSELAVKVNIQIIRIFTKMREMMLTHKDILLKLEQLERQESGHDDDIKRIFGYLEKLLRPDFSPRKRVGFRRSDETD